ncbi:class I adenylate-forming enzyme family protein [Novosphingobium sp. PY1]|uniref:class I adenylate-forming enzyme family protein n=1 Tax=Novosphingobium sp. PY1 TaxID=1882221 RepID=UPI001A8D15E8|nr:class I adenylate-forming enzyme family protein [Novosphingobium sp. PY1]GFM30303.1 putative AMP-dependent synthetase and ligase [Novosphingobium sp. PY1]
MFTPQSRTVPGLVHELAQEHGDRPALSFGETTVTFAKFEGMARDCAKALIAAGVGRGDKIGLLMGNRIEWLVVATGAHMIGATLCALNTWYTNRELSYVLEHSDTSVLIMAARFLKKDYVPLMEDLQPWDRNFPHLRQIIVFEGVPGEAMASYDDFLSAGAQVTDATLDSAITAVTPEDVAYLLYTSGSTSRPKGVMLAHRGLIENMTEIGARLGFDESDAFFLPVSLFWGMGCENGVFAAWTHATHIVLQHHFDADEAIRLIDRYRCTALYGTANILQAISEHPAVAQFDISTLRKGVVSGTPDQIEDVLTNLLPDACPPYGLTETYGFVSMGDRNDTVEQRSTTHGKPVPGMDVIIVDPDSGAEVPTGETGEVYVKGRTMVGYYKAPEQTAESFDANGYFKTGDLGRFDADGFFHFRGRSKEMLKTGGLNVSPLEVEEVLMQHPGVSEAHVTGLPDPDREQIVAAVLVPSPGSELSLDDVLAHCKVQLAAFKVPRRLEILRSEDIPLTTTGKVHKQRLAEFFAKAEQE